MLCDFCFVELVRLNMNTDRFGIDISFSKPAATKRRARHKTNTGTTVCTPHGVVDLDFLFVALSGKDRMPFCTFTNVTTISLKNILKGFNTLLVLH